MSLFGHAYMISVTRGSTWPHPAGLNRVHTRPADLDIGLPRQVAELLDTTEAGLAQMRYRGTGPRFVKVGKKVLYRWSDVRDYLDANTLQRTDDPRGGDAA